MAKFRTETTKCKDAQIDLMHINQYAPSFSNPWLIPNGILPLASLGVVPSTDPEPPPPNVTPSGRGLLSDQ